MYEIIVSDLAKKQLAKLPELIRNKIGWVIERIRIRPHHFVKRLVGSQYYKLRVGDYRLILDIKNLQSLYLVFDYAQKNKPSNFLTYKR